MPIYYVSCNAAILMLHPSGSFFKHLVFSLSQGDVIYMVMVTNLYSLPRVLERCAEVRLEVMLFLIYESVEVWKILSFINKFYCSLYANYTVCKILIYCWVFPINYFSKSRFDWERNSWICYGLRIRCWSVYFWQIGKGIRYI